MHDTSTRLRLQLKSVFTTQHVFPCPSDVVGSHSPPCSIPPACQNKPVCSRVICQHERKKCMLGKLRRKYLVTLAALQELTHRSECMCTTR